MAFFAAWLAVPMVLDVSPMVACPERQQLAEALNRQGLEATDAAGARAVLHLEPVDGGLLLQVREIGGQALLARRLPQTDCTVLANTIALADTIALIVERRIRELGWAAELPVVEPRTTITPAATDTVASPRTTIAPAPAPAPAVPRTIELRAGALVADDLDSAGPAVGPLAGFRVRPWPVFEAGLTGGWVRYELNVASGAVTVDQVPLALDAGSAFGRGRWELGVRARLELAIMRSSSRDLPRTEQTSGVSSRLGPAVSASVGLWRTWWLSLEGGAGVRISGYRLTVTGLGPIAEQRLISLSAVVSLGTRWKF